MSYTALAVIAVLVVIAVDLWVARTRLLTRRIFWVSYAIILGFQFLTNGLLTGLRVVRYDGAVIIGDTSPDLVAPPFLGQGRLFFAPVEDVLFGFALVLGTLVLWVAAGRAGIQRTPSAGPARLPIAGASDSQASR